MPAAPLQAHQTRSKDIHPPVDVGRTIRRLPSSMVCFRQNMHQAMLIVKTERALNLKWNHKKLKVLQKQMYLGGQRCERRWWIKLAGEVTVHSLRKGKGHGHLVEMWEILWQFIYSWWRWKHLICRCLYPGFPFFLLKDWLNHLTLNGHGGERTPPRLLENSQAAPSLSSPKSGIISASLSICASSPGIPAVLWGREEAVKRRMMYQKMGCLQDSPGLTLRTAKACDEGHLGFWEERVSQERHRPPGKPLVCPLCGFKYHTAWACLTGGQRPALRLFSKFTRKVGAVGKNAKS